MSNPTIPSIAQSFNAGDKLAGCYMLKEQIPAQGACVVWVAHDEELGKDIALHFVPDSVAADTRAMGELKQEAKRNRQLIHPRIVRVHDLVEDEKWAAISMDHILGETLAALQTKHEKKAFHPSELAAGISELCQTLEDAHRIDLFHRDLTPENLLATSNGIMVQKFGISRVILDSLARSGQQAENARDLSYLSPQQLDGEKPTRGDDIYSLGASIYDLLTGAAPFSEGDVAPQIRKTVPPLISERRAALGITGEPTPKAWDEAVALCLAKNPEERPKSAAEAGTRFSSGKPGGAALNPVAIAGAAAAEAAIAATASAQPPAAEGAKAGPGAVKDEPAKGTPTPEQEAAGKQSKRPWATGPGKTPVIAEATVISKTPVPKGEGDPKAEGAAEPTPGKPGEPATATGGGSRKGGPTTPTGFPLRAFVEVEGDAKQPKGKSHAGLIAAALVLIVIVSYFVARPKGGGGDTAVANPGNTDAQPASTEPGSTPAAAEAASPAPAPVNVAENSTPAPSAPAETASPAPSAPAAVAESPAPLPALGNLTDAQADQLVAEKTKAVDQAKAALAAAEKAAKDQAAAQAQAAAAIQDVQTAIKQKSDAAAAAKKTADDAAATLKQQQDALQKAEAEAADAQKAAAAKAQAADQLRKTVQDAQAAAQQQQAAQQQAETAAAEMSKAAADRQKAADQATAAAAAAEKARQQQAQALAQAQAELGQVQAASQQAAQARAAEKARMAAEEATRLQKERQEKAARDAEAARKAAEENTRIQKARAAEATRLAAQAAAAAKAAEDAEKALEAAKKAVADAEKAQHDAEAQAEAARNGALPMTSPAPTPEATPSAPTPAPAASAPSLTIKAANPHLKVDQALTNSLGMRFAPVGNVFFSIWLTRVQDFEAFANATGYKPGAWREPGFKQSPDHPVVNVSWNDANQFCLWLTQKEHNDGILSANETYRLPTDLEWSNAVGLPAETGRTPESRDMDVPDVYPWGTQWPPPAGAGNYTGEETDSDVAIKGYNDGFAWTSPVGSFTANKFGLFDMGGNVWEWCVDWWNPEQKAKVLRGGSWYNGALKLSLLSSCRIHASADQGTDNYGFRIVLSQEQTKEKSGKHHAQ